MKYTNVGIYLKKMRIDNNETLSDMATKLSISPAFLSSVETGKRNMPKTMIKKICDVYCFDNERKNDFFESIATSNNKVDFTFEEGSTKKNTIALSFAAMLSDLTDEQLDSIAKILEEG